MTMTMASPCCFTIIFRSSGPSEGEINRWKCLPGFRSCLGFEETPESPDAHRGGDTSLFSLPSDSANTPHTSNVSVTTTITSAISPARIACPMGRNVDGVRLRRTLEALSTLLDRLSKACAKLKLATNSSNEVSKLAAEEVKRVYLQLLAIKSDYLNALINSFELDLPPMKITRMVSEDRNDLLRDPYLGHPVLPISSNLRVAPPAAPPAYGHPTGHSIPRGGSGTYNQGSQGNMYDHWGRVNLFSPSTEDMNSIDNYTNETDDLRRTTGSFDREDSDNVRENPPNETHLGYSEQRNMQTNGHKRGRHRGSNHLKTKEASE